ncbi:ribonuclease H-like domain-containing protein, partial [Tanacetum coccineum]
LPSSALKGKSPFELVYGLKPKLSHLRSFGCLCFSYSSPSEGNVPPSSSGLNTHDFPENESQVQPIVWRSSRSRKMPVKMSTVRCMLNVDVCNNWVLFQLDINNAFLYGDLTEDVYMSLPLGFDNQQGKVCKLNIALYGLKQAPRQWNAKLTMTLIENGFVQSKFDYSLFTKKSGDVFVALLVYVDNTVIIGNNLSKIEKFKVFLKSIFQIKDLGKLKYFLGIKVLDNADGICLS